MSLFEYDRLSFLNSDIEPVLNKNVLLKMSQNQSLKILHVVPAMDPEFGGMCHAVSTMVDSLLGRGIHNEVVSLDDSDAPFLNGSKIIIHALGRGKNPWAYNKRLMPWLVTNLNYFDLVIVHGMWSYFGYAVRKVMNLLGQIGEGTKQPKLFVMPHGMLNNSAKNNLYWKFIERKLIHIADGILYTSEEEKIMAALPLKQFSPKREYVVGLGVEAPPVFEAEMEDLLKLKCPGLGDNSYLLFMGNISEANGVDLLVKTYISARFKLQAEKGLPRAIGLMPKLLISGNGLDTSFGKSLVEIVEQASLTDTIIFTGMLTGQARWGAMYGCEAIVLPSHKEYFGLDVITALSCGKPALVSEKVLIWREIYENGACYVGKDDMAGTAELLEFWGQASYKQKQALSGYALQAYQKMFTPELATSKILKAIKDTFQESAPKPNNT